MKPIQLIPANTRIDFTGKRKIAFIFSVALVALSVFFFLSRGLNYGIDFEGGIMLDVAYETAPDLYAVRGNLETLGLGDVEIQEFGEPNNILVRVQRQEGDEKAQLAAILTIKEALGEGLDYRRTEFVGPKVGDELIQAGLTAVILALLAMMIYIWFRFEWQFGIGALTALSHDVITTIGLFAVLQLEFNLATIAAILTIAGYSINDTVVVYDRVRENLRKYRKMDMLELLNLSINQTLARTTMTSVTTLLALVALYIFGGAVIHDFVLAMMWGVFIGTYSSIFVAAPLLIKLKLRPGSAGALVAEETKTP
ncbi:MAG: protein translocase subunit SecF [Rhodospirillaceae bacterium]|jgi:preprotein translocase subunit SecF|nr:protein translocase subunit SecF [Rhodospirillaceae bacterium]MBT5660101.1 protein translocase subunit SecF [Rhodospirillaceae bacterium]MBT5751944.1 protein translocase subunit SecF [Rhodospirillaceae bacterium]